MKDESDAQDRSDPARATTTRIALAGGTALLVAGLTLVMFVLPAEYAVDPLGIGARTGLLKLGQTGAQIAAFGSQLSPDATPSVVVAPQRSRFQHETVTFALAAREFVEYKYRLDKGSALLFSWSAPASVDYEAHAEPDGAPRGYAQSYEKGHGAERSGTLTAPFAGIHGWYWENTTDGPLVLTLTTAGFYSLSHEFRKDLPVKNKMFQ